MGTEEIVWGEDQDPDFVDDDMRRPGEKIDYAPFPVLLTDKDRKCLAGPAGLKGCMSVVPWWLVEPHEEQAKKNHGGQTLRELAARGGLGPDELVAVLEDRPWHAMALEGAARQLSMILHKATNHCHDEEPDGSSPEKGGDT